MEEGLLFAHGGALLVSAFLSRKKLTISNTLFAAIFVLPFTLFTTLCIIYIMHGSAGALAFGVLSLYNLLIAEPCIVIALVLIRLFQK